MLFKMGQKDDAVPQFVQFRAVLESKGSKDVDPDLLRQAEILSHLLGL